VDGEPAILVRLGVLTDAPPAADDVTEGDVHQATVQVDVADLQAAQLAAANAGDRRRPQVQSQGGAARASLGDHLGHVIRRGSRDELGGRDGYLPWLNWEPVSGFEPLTCRLQEVRPHAPHALAAPMARAIALTALAALGLSRAPFHETFHAEGRQWPMTVTGRSDRDRPQRHLNLTAWSNRTGHRF